MRGKFDFHVPSEAELKPVHTPSLVSIAQLEKLGSQLAVRLEGLNDHVVDLVAPDENIAPHPKTVPLIGCSQSPGLHDILKSGSTQLTRLPRSP